jgi:hypothetical protein
MTQNITTINGETHPVENCRLIDGAYYLIGDINLENSGDVYLINNRFIRFITGKVVFNHSAKQYQLRNSTLIDGVVGFENEIPIFGYFESTTSTATIITLENGSRKYAMDDIDYPLDYREKMSNGNYYHISTLRSFDFSRLVAVKSSYKESLQYDSRGITDEYSARYEANYNPKISSHIEAYGKSLQGLTFGFEFETVLGSVPERNLVKLPLIPLRDGSVAGLEYVTIPLKGGKGIQAVLDSVKELKKRTTYDDSCALHLHIGGMPRTPEFILAFYKLTAFYQNEMFSMFPLYKKYNFGVKRENYSKPFPVEILSPQIEPIINIKNKSEVDRGFKVLFDYFAEINTFEDYDNSLKNVESHPRDPSGKQKWNIKTRYYAVNFIPLIFGNKQTVEFRIHTPTYDESKIVNFLLLNSYLINYVKNNTAAILNNPRFLHGKRLINIVNDHIVNECVLDLNIKKTLINSLDDYLSRRRSNTEHQNSQGDIRGNEEHIIIGNNLNLNITENFTAKADSKRWINTPSFSEMASGIRRERVKVREAIRSEYQDGIPTSPYVQSGELIMRNSIASIPTAVYEAGRAKYTVSVDDLI